MCLKEVLKGNLLKSIDRLEVYDRYDNFEDVIVPAMEMARFNLYTRKNIRSCSVDSEYNNSDFRMHYYVSIVLA